MRVAHQRPLWALAEGDQKGAGDRHGSHPRAGALRWQVLVVHSNDDTLTAEDMALGYKQLQRVEESWRTMKSSLRMRPVFHWAPHRIHAHIPISVLALLLERTIEHACQDTWRNIRDDLKHIQLAQLLSPNGTVWQVTDPPQSAANRLKLLKIKPPAPILGLA